MVHSHDTTTRARPTAIRQRPARKRPAYDTVGLFEIDAAAHLYAAWWGTPEQAYVLKPLLREGVSRAENCLETVTVDGLVLTSLRWIIHFIVAARDPESSPARVAIADTEGETNGAEDAELDLNLIATAYTLDDDNDEGAALIDEEHWTSDDEDAFVEGGVIGEYSYTTMSVPRGARGPDVPTGTGVGDFLRWLRRHHPGLYWLMEGLLVFDATPAGLADQAGVSEATISRYRAIARQLYEDAHGFLSSPSRSSSANVDAGRVDGRVARGRATQERDLAAIAEMTELYQRPPTIRELLRFLGESSMSALHRRLAALMQEGRLRVAAGGRGLEVVRTQALGADAATSDIVPNCFAKADP